jgi:TRAP-type C4-dicarboxylate transport system permease small subunit
MNILPGVKANPVIGAATIFAAFLITYQVTEPMHMKPLYRAVVIGGMCMAIYIITDMVIRAVD